jgi:hypothetical protein
MILHYVTEFGLWSWFILGAVLLIAEITVPGMFLMWIGIAALLTGLLSLLFWETSWWLWQVQWPVFAVLSAASVFVGRKWVLKRGEVTDEPDLNQRSRSLIGRTAELFEPIANGRGRVKLDGSIWLVEGPDLPAGAKIRVKAATGHLLLVEAV